MISKHSIHSEFPEFDSKISSLKTSNSHFRKLYEEYNNIDKEIYHLEVTEKFSDAPLENLKKKRVFLKDELLDIIKKS